MEIKEMYLPLSHLSVSLYVCSNTHTTIMLVLLMISSEHGVLYYNLYIQNFMSADLH